MNNAQNWCCYSVCMLAVISAMGGCSAESPYALVPVSGRVTLDGEPLPGARVNFSPKAVGDAIDAGPTSIAYTDAEGRFQLSVARRNGRPGAMPGDHRVSITDEGDSAAEGEDPDETTYEELEQLLDVRGLTFTVPVEGTDQANFELTSQ